MGEEEHMNACFSHFIVFADEFSLLDRKDMKPILSLVDQILEQNPRM